jgi:hypothetical protein
MGDRKTSIFSHDLRGRVGTDAAPIASPVRAPDVEHKLALPGPDQAGQLSADPLHDDLFVVYCGNAQRVSEGFALALRVMGVEGHVDLPTTHQDREDN